MSFQFDIDKLMLKQFTGEILVYFEKHKLKEIITRVIVEAGLIRPENPHVWLAVNIRRTAHEIYNEYKDCVLRNRNDEKIYRLPGGFLRRILIFGRPGSGKKTQARALFMRFDLVYLDVEALIYKNLQVAGTRPVDLQEGYNENKLVKMSASLCSLLNERLLQEDCMCRGWVVFNFPRVFCELREIMEGFSTPPNKILYFKCPEEIAVCRLVNKPRLGNPIFSVDYIKDEMSSYRKREPKIDDYLRKRLETVYIDASLDSNLVKMQILKVLDKVPYFMGFKCPIE